MSAHIANIESQQKYHSFVVAKTREKEIAQKWDYYILSVDGELYMNMDDVHAGLEGNGMGTDAGMKVGDGKVRTNGDGKGSQCQKKGQDVSNSNPGNTSKTQPYYYNICLDTISYSLAHSNPYPYLTRQKISSLSPPLPHQHHSQPRQPTPSTIPDTHHYQRIRKAQPKRERKLILAEGNWLKQCLMAEELERLGKLEVVEFGGLGLSGVVEFWYYVWEGHVDFEGSGKDLNEGERNVKYDIKTWKPLNPSLTPAPPPSPLPSTLQPFLTRFSPTQSLQHQLSQFLSSEMFIPIKPKYMHINDCLIFEIEQFMENQGKQRQEQAGKESEEWVGTDTGIKTEMGVRTGDVVNLYDYSVIDQLMDKEEKVEKKDEGEGSRWIEGKQVNNTNKRIKQKIHQYILNNLHYKPISKTSYRPYRPYSPPRPPTPTPTRVPNPFLDNTYNFKSQYALLSNQHFLNCLVRGRKAIGSYQLINGKYYFVIDEGILRVLGVFYMGPKL